MDDLELYKQLKEQENIINAIKETVGEYIDINNTLKKIANDTKVLKERKSKLEEDIINFMKENNKEIINVNGGKIKFSTKIQKTQPNKKQILDCIKTNVSIDTYERILNFLEKEQEEMEVENIKLSK